MPSGHRVLQAPQSRQLKMRSSRTSDGSISLLNSFFKSAILPRALMPSLANSILVGHRALQLPHRTQRSGPDLRKSLFLSSDLSCFRSSALFIEIPAPESFDVDSDMLEPEFTEALRDSYP